MTLRQLIRKCEGTSGWPRNESAEVVFVVQVTILGVGIFMEIRNRDIDVVYSDDQGEITFLGEADDISIGRAHPGN